MLRFRHNTIITAVMVGTLGLNVTAATELAQYKGLHYNVEERYVTDEDVKKAVEDKFSSTVKYERILDRKVAGFDRLDVDYDAYCDGELLESNKGCGVTLGSDAFFPFSDNIERAHKSGVKYIAQPGGSVRDDLVIECCNKYQMVMAFTGIRLFHH